MAPRPGEQPLTRRGELGPGVLPDTPGPDAAGTNAPPSFGAMQSADLPEPARAETSAARAPGGRIDVQA